VVFADFSLSALPSMLIPLESFSICVTDVGYVVLFIDVRETEEVENETVRVGR